MWVRGDQIWWLEKVIDSGGSCERRWFGILEFAEGATLLNWLGGGGSWW